MDIVDRWMLPDGVDEVLPPQAARLEKVRRKLLDGFESWGYDFVIPPMVEFLESLLTGTGSDLDLKTFKITDQISGRMMGVRADITPQVARIDAHSMNQDGDVRLCYAGTVLHAKADNMLASRTPISVGAELFSSTEGEGDLEIVSLMIQSIKGFISGSPHIELGDVGIFRELMEIVRLDQSDEDVLFELIQRKALPDLEEMIAKLDVEPNLAEILSALPNLCGNKSVLEEGRVLFADFPKILLRLENLQKVTTGVQQRFKEIDIYYDLSELRGYNYHTGIVFAAYLQSTGQRVAKGGRYDGVGEVFGRARCATGFDIDLKALAGLLEGKSTTSSKICVAKSALNEVDCWIKISELREQGNIVIESEACFCDQRLVKENGEWVLEQL
ncbi:MAG: ATP phosphoribosyltransferase regulatory subunit [Pseudomonadales bacterium]|nr:ATP phosphoribosyltransferase regulatory subunit [Pseudomonadales bacterium]